METFRMLAIFYLAVFGILALLGIAWAVLQRYQRKKWMKKSLMEVFTQETEDQKVVVEFECWGQSCYTTFPDIHEALRWSTTCFIRGYNNPIQLSNGCGEVLYDKKQFWSYVTQHQ